MLKLTITGNLGSDCEQRFTEAGKSIISMNVAVNTRRKDKDGEWKDHTDWIRIRSMRTFEGLAERLVKGTRVLAIGDLQTGDYISKDGEKRFTLDLWADTIEILTPRTSPSTENGESRRPPAATIPHVSPRSVREEDPLDLDSLPF